MHISSKSLSLLMLGLLFLLTGCVPINTGTSPLPTEAPGLTRTVSSSVFGVTPDPGHGAVVGRVVTASTNSAVLLAGMPVRLAQVFWNADKSDGAFVLEGATSPSALIQQDGSFVFAKVLPADYVIVIGDPFGQNAIITEPNGKARVITVEAGKTLNVGTLVAVLKSP